MPLTKGLSGSGPVSSGGSRISQRRGAYHKGGVPTDYLANFSQKLHENEEILGQRGAHIPRAPLDPPLVRHASKSVGTDGCHHQITQCGYISAHVSVRTVCSRDGEKQYLESASVQEQELKGHRENTQWHLVTAHEVTWKTPHAHMGWAVGTMQ